MSNLGDKNVDSIKELTKEIIERFKGNISEEEVTNWLETKLTKLYLKGYNQGLLDHED